MIEITGKGSESKAETIAACGMNLLSTFWILHASIHWCKETTIEPEKKEKRRGRWESMEKLSEKTKSPQLGKE